jgi:hypothetical protein
MRSFALRLPALAAALAVFATTGCGKQEPPRTPEPKAATPAKKAPAKPQMKLASELGYVDPKEVDATFARTQESLLACLEQRTSVFDGVGGGFSVFLRLSDEGRVRWGHLESSTLGDRKVEKCILDVFRKTQWPRPDQGDAEVRNKLDFDLPEGVRPPQALAAARFQNTLGPALPKLAACRGGEKIPVEITAYLDTKGYVLSAGAASRDGKLNGELDCMVDVVRGLSFPSPGSYPAKVTFPID